MCDVPEIYSESKVKARKIHWCAECYWKIERGETYVRISGKWDEFQTFSLHDCCKALADIAEEKFRQSPYDDCIHIGGAHEYLREAEIKLDPEERKVWWQVARNIARKKAFLKRKRLAESVTP